MEDCSIGLHFFEKVQDLPTRGAVGVEHFTIDRSLFLAFANYHGDIKKYKTSSMIYKMDNSTGRLSLYQTLQTRGAYGLEYFSIANKHFLAVANRYDGRYRLDSSVYQWNGKLFVDFQKLSTNGASHFTYLRDLGKIILPWPTTMTEVPTLQSQLSTNGAAASLTDFKTYQLTVPPGAQRLW